MLQLSAFCSGLVFGLGLLLAGMTNPAKVQAFLDLAGQWDPSLALVMASAVGVALVPFAWAKRQQRSLFGSSMHMPVRREIDRRLILGSLLFGAGWGIAGFCPGPALVSLLTGYWQVILFCAAMLAGMLLFEVLERQRNH